MGGEDLQAKGEEHYTLLAPLNNLFTEQEPGELGPDDGSSSSNSAFASMYRGVSWYPSGQMWEAIITVKNKRRHLGYFHDELEAAQAYDRSAKELQKDPLLNFNDDGSLNPDRKKFRHPKALRGQPKSSQYVGVSWDKKNRKWRAAIRIDGKKRSLGDFECEKDAAKAYDRVASKHLAEPHLNFPMFKSSSASSVSSEDTPGAVMMIMPTDAAAPVSAPTSTSA